MQQNKCGWYVLYVRSAKELEVAKAIESRLRIITLVPMRELMESNGGKWKTAVKPLIPGYVFITGNITPWKYYKLVAIPNVFSLLGMQSDGIPIPVPDHEMRPILNLWAESQVCKISKMIKGEDSVESGPLKLLEDRITKIDRRRGRAMVELQILGETRTLEFGIDTISDQTVPVDSSRNEDESDHNESNADA